MDPRNDASQPKKKKAPKLMERKGKFIVLEGIDNCGKTTQSKILEKHLIELGIPVIQSREPGGTEVGEEIRGVVTKPRQKVPNPVTQALLFYAARQEFVDNVVKPNLEEGKYVITDRFEASTFVYQGLVQGVDVDFINSLSTQVVTNSNCTPDLYVVLDIPAEESFKRSQNEDNHGQELIYEKQGLAFTKKLRAGYLKYAEMNRGSVVVLDGMQDKEKIFKEILKLLKL